MFLIVKDGSYTSIYNINLSTILRSEKDNDSHLPYKIIITIDQQEACFFSTDDKFEGQTAMAAIIGAIKRADHSLEIVNPAGISETALIAKATKFYTGLNAIATIKMIRERTNWGLNMAKDFFDVHIRPTRVPGTAAQAMQAQHQAQARPDRPAP
jgi:hypothetical protein